MDSNSLTIFISTTLIGIVVPLALILLQFRANSSVSNKNILKYPSGLAVLAVFTIIGPIALTILGFFQEHDYDATKSIVFAIVASIAFFVMGSYLLLISLNFRFVFEKDYLTYKNMFGRIRKLLYSEITRVVVFYYPNCKPSYLCWIYVGRVRIELNSYMSNYNYFVDQILKVRLKQAKNPVVIEKKMKNQGKKNKP